LSFFFLKKKKTQEGLKEIPTSTTTATEPPLYQDATAEDRLRGLPGADSDHSFSQHPTSQVSSSCLIYGKLKNRK
jgi:peroxin-5